VNVPDDLRYTSEHEWVRRLDSGEGGERLRVGITDYAQDSLGDVVFVTLPEAGTSVTAGQPLGEIESTKSVSDVFAPIAGTVTGRNEGLDEHPELVNSAPYSDGWLVEIQPSEPGSYDGLLDAASYREGAGKG
jgi:glycine cleavage system H protein